MNNRSSLLAFSITLALNAPREEVLAAIDDIKDVFGIDDAGSVSPKSLTVGNSGIAPPDGVVTSITSGNNSEVDSTGLPWDERIHSSNKAKVADGSWRARRNVDAGLKSKVEAELRATMAVAPNTPPTAPLAPPTPGSNAAAPAGPKPPAPPSPPAPVAAPANPAYTNFVNYIAEQINGGIVDAEWVKASLLNFGVANGDMQNLAHNPDLIPGIESAIKSALGQ